MARNKLSFRVALILSGLCLATSAAMAASDDAVEGRAGAWNRSGQGAPNLAKARAKCEKNPKDPIALNDLGFALRQVEKPEEAETYLKQAIELKPDMAQAHTNLSVVYFDLKRYDDAVKEAMQAVKLDANHPVFRVVLGNALSKTGDLKGAAQEYRVAIKLKPNYENAHYNLGRVLFEDGQTTDAKFALADAINLDPNDERTLVLLDKIESGGSTAGGASVPAAAKQTKRAESKGK
ncbi:MAG: tetratricopeptide repeat protein [Candidatus Obscuribacterales bacterium]|nr:tetratricopeptide repeat protein [Candidatus Obscuribacterales bacterium]